MLEGIDGAGKTTLRGAIAEQLRARGHEVVETKEPTDGPYGKKIRELAKVGRKTVSALEEFDLFHEDRKEHVKSVVLPALERGAIVLQDRSFFSSVAYQGDRGLDREELFARSRSIAPEPDVLLVVDVPAEVSLERIGKTRAGADDFESLEQLRRIRNVFLALPGKTLIDATQPLDAALAKSLDTILLHLSERSP